MQYRKYDRRSFVVYAIDFGQTNLASNKSSMYEHKMYVRVYPDYRAEIGTFRAELYCFMSSRVTNVYRNARGFEVVLDNLDAQSYTLVNYVRKYKESSVRR